MSEFLSASVCAGITRPHRRAVYGIICLFSGLYTSQVPLDTAYEGVICRVVYITIAITKSYLLLP